MSVSAEDLLAKAQAVIDKRAALGISVNSAAKEKAEYDDAHGKAMADNTDYAAAFDDFVSSSSSFQKDDVTIP